VTERVKAKFEEQKWCCSSCAQKRRCSVCDEPTTTACLDCAIDLRVTVYVCGTRACRDHHETKCGAELRKLKTRAESALTEREREVAALTNICNYGVADGAPDRMLRDHRRYESLCLRRSRTEDVNEQAKWIALACEARAFIKTYGDLDADENLIDRCKKAEAEVERLKAEVELYRQSDEALHAKFDECPHKHDGPCGCSYDRPGDVCLVHSPKLREAEAELAALRARCERLEAPVSKEESQFFWWRGGPDDLVTSKEGVNRLIAARAAARVETKE